MISSTLGAPLGGTTVGGHQVFEFVASSVMTPPNGGGGGGSCLPSIVVVAPGVPSTPVICVAGLDPVPGDEAQPVAMNRASSEDSTIQALRFDSIDVLPIWSAACVATASRRGWGGR